METDVAGTGIVKVRISNTLSEGEKKAIASRKVKVKEGLDKLGIPCDADKIPNIAVLASGGALRAMIALYRTLVELKKYNLLDCVMYLGGVSGSTWCMPDLYKNEDWEDKIETLEKRQHENLVQGHLEIEKAIKAVLEAVEDEHYSLTDIWSYFLLHELLNQFDETELSAHATSCENGKNPYPIYAAVDQETYQKQHAGTWFEFTPHEAGLPGLGAYVDIKYFWSIFQNGQMVEEKKAKNICYLKGLWGSALGSKEELKKKIEGSLRHLRDLLRHHTSTYSSSTDLDQDDQKLNILYEGYHSLLELHLSESLDGREAEKHFDDLENILKNYSSSKSYELLREIRQTWYSADEETRKNEHLRLFHALDTDFGGKYHSDDQALYKVIKKTWLCLRMWTWGKTNNFLYRCSDVEFPELTSKAAVSLIDAGLAINTAYPPILRPERDVKLILSFDFSAGDPFLTIRQAAEYCDAHGIPFPKIDGGELQDIDNPSDCYIFRGEQVPTVMHFPQFNNVNCPGEVAKYREQFSTFKMSYSDEEIEKLLTATMKNVANVQEKIQEEIKRIVGPPSQKA
ncbi:cytosolic phospholipase A2 gamma-like [Elgaria multicarinata webbii]|uniref:cytosolic phospholipase A2 gamma-like n=1 Tax=Elgaria multicarinata webbii TaxID=159646 RepID=UPI002FCD60F2